jgi:hypothetical protein
MRRTIRFDTVDSTETFEFDLGDMGIFECTLCIARYRPEQGGMFDEKWVAVPEALEVLAVDGQDLPSITQEFQSIINRMLIDQTLVVEVVTYFD